MWTCEGVIRELKGCGKRITVQRRIMIEEVVEGGCTNFKELYARILKRDPQIGQATVYRMLLTLEEIGVIERIQGYILTEPKDSSIRPEPEDSSIQPEPEDSSIHPELKDSSIFQKPEDSSILPEAEDSLLTKA